MKVKSLFSLTLILVASLVINCFGQSESKAPIDNVDGLRSALLSLKSTDETTGKSLLKYHSTLIDRDLCLYLMREAEFAHERRDTQKCILFYELAIDAVVLFGRPYLLRYGAPHQLGDCYYEKGLIKKAIEANLRLKKICEEADNPGEVVYLLADLGLFYRVTGDYEAAEHYALQGEELSRRLKTASDRGMHEVADWGLNSCWYTLGAVSAKRGKHKQALTFFENALSLARELAKATPNINENVAWDLVAVGEVYWALGDYGTALRHTEEAVSIGRTLEGKRPLIGALTNLGLIFESQGEYLESIRVLTHAIELAVSATDRMGFARATYNRGICYLKIQDYAKALTEFQESLKIADQLETKDLILTVKEGISTVHRSMGQYQLALDYLDQSSAMAETTGNAMRMAEILYLKGEVRYLQREYSLTAGLADQSYKLAERLNPIHAYWAMTLKGKACIAQGHYDVARSALSRAIDIIETIRETLSVNELSRANFIEGSRNEPYTLMAELLIREHKETEALAYAERAKARVLLDVLQSGKSNINAVMTVEERDRDTKLSGNVASLNRAIYSIKQQDKPDKAQLEKLSGGLEKARQEYESFRGSLYASHPELKTPRITDRQFDLDEIGSTLRQGNTAVLEFVVGEQTTRAFVAMPAAKDAGQQISQVFTYEVHTSRKELADLVQLFSERLANPNITEESVSRRLYHTLIAPAKRYIGDRTTLAIVPDNILWELPFQALRQPDNRYLVESYNIFYAPSLSVLATMTEKTRISNGGHSQINSSAGLLALGNPSLSAQTIRQATALHRDEKLGPLPDAEKEVKALGTLYRREKTAIHVGPAAREDRAKLEMDDYPVLHFATHGILDSNNPMYSHIVLSTDEKSPDDGLLEAWEIMRMDLKADLVVLSACDTARGRIGGGEGVIGMSWAFFVAGCPTTVVSQWGVDSAGTAELMIEFHRNLVLKSPVQETSWKKAQALRKAMLKVMKNPKYRDPYYWAGFVVVGAG